MKKSYISPKIVVRKIHVVAILAGSGVGFTSESYSNDNALAKEESFFYFDDLSE